MRTTIYLATGSGLSVISGSGEKWKGVVHLGDKPIQCVAADLKRGVVHCGTFGYGMLQSGNEGVTWKASHGFSNRNVMALAVSNSGLVYAGTEPSAIFRSDDGGESWRELPTLLTLPSAATWSYPPRPKTHHVQSILSDLAKPGRLHVAIEAGALLRSDDAGCTWRDRIPSGPKDTHSLAVHSQEPTRLHSAAGDGYFESGDGGDSWQRIVDGLKHQYCWSIAVSNANPTTLLLSASKGAYTAHFKLSASSCIYRRAGNEAWRRVQDGLPIALGARISVVAASRVEPGIFYLSVESDVYRSEDDGLQWRKLEIHWDGKAPRDYPLNMAIVEEG